MDLDAIKKLQYSYAEQNNLHLFPQLLIDSLELVLEFFKHGSSNKLCLVFPSKELAAQWISMPLSLRLLEDEYKLNNEVIQEAYKYYKPGQKLLLNNEAIVEWVSGDKDKFTFITKGSKRKKYWESTIGDKITIQTTRINNLKPAPIHNAHLSSKESVSKNLKPQSPVPIDKLLNISSNGNFLFQKKSICLISRFNSYEESIDQIQLNGFLIQDYFQEGKIDDDGKSTGLSPLIVANNFTNLALYLTQTNTIAKIIIDGYKAIHDKGNTDFSDIDREFNLPTILITDLSEIETFENIGNHGFHFFSFTKENISPIQPSKTSPFYSLESKLDKYFAFQFQNELCTDHRIEAIVKSIQSIEDDESDHILTTLRISLIQLINNISRIAHPPSDTEVLDLNDKLHKVELLFGQNKRWLGDAIKSLEETIIGIKLVIDQFGSKVPEKYLKLKLLLEKEHYDYIICLNESEAESLSNHLTEAFQSIKVPNTISVSRVDDSLITHGAVNVILTGWPKASNFNRLLSSFLFSKLTVLFYQFENEYYNSLQRRNLKNLANVKTTINRNGLIANEASNSRGFGDLYKTFNVLEEPTQDIFDIVEFELKVDDAQYSKYYAKGITTESSKAKRIDFENSTFFYASESHKFIVINELLEAGRRDPKIHNRKLESVHTGDVIALINTDRDILVELVESTARPEEFRAVKQLTDLWKNLLKDYHGQIGSDFKRLVSDLRKLECIKHEVTIRTWLQDENRIGPDDDADLLTIGLLTNSEQLSDNIPAVRKAIDQMIKWRFQASEFVRDSIKKRLVDLAGQPIINNSFDIQDLGRVDILKVLDVSKSTQHIDRRYVNRLLQREII